MLLFEAAQQFKERLKIDDLRENIPEYYEAMEIAVKAIEAQINLAAILDNFYAEDEEKHKNDMYSRLLCLELLESCRFDFIPEEEE